MILWFAVLLSDAFIAYCAGRYFDARQEKRRTSALAYGAALDLAIGINAMGFVEQKWLMLIPSVMGGLVGTWLSFGKRST